MASLNAKIALLGLYEPSIVFWPRTGIGHFVVMIGVDGSNGRILYNDPNGGVFTSKSVSDWINEEYGAASKERTFIACDIK